MHAKNELEKNYKFFFSIMIWILKADVKGIKM